MENGIRSYPEQEELDPTAEADARNDQPDPETMQDDTDAPSSYGDETVSAAFAPRFDQDPAENGQEEEFDTRYEDEDGTITEAFQPRYDDEDATASAVYQSQDSEEDATVSAAYQFQDSEEDATVSAAYQSQDGDGDSTVSAAYQPEYGQNPARFDVGGDDLPKADGTDAADEQSGVEPVYANSPNYRSGSDVPPPAAPEKKTRKKWLIPGIAAAVLIIAAAVGIPIIREQNNIKRYNSGADLLESGDYQGAYDVFSELGDYEDAPAIAEYARRGVAYTAAKELMDKKDYAAAAETFEGLYGFKDSRELAGRCRKEISYQRAVKLFDEGDYDGARDVFAQLSGFREADDYVVRCEQEKAYLNAVALFEEGEYARARDAFSEMGGFRDSDDYVKRCRHELADIAYNDAFRAGKWKKALEVLDSGEGQWENEAAMRTECNNHITYEEAEKDLAKGLNFTAYKKFKSLGSFLDSEERAKNCKLSKPANGEVYRNSNYRGTTVTVKFKTPNDGSFSYLKIYAVGSGGDEVLASTLFIRANKTVSVKLPAGKYVIKSAYGFGAWYGEKEMFGDEGVYQRMVFDNGSRSVNLKKNYIYTITLRSGTDGNVGSAGESIDTF